MHDRQHLLRPARTHEVGVLVVDLADLLKGLGSDHDYGKGVETFGPVDREMANRFLVLFCCGSVFDERQSDDGLTGAQDTGFQVGTGVENEGRLRGGSSRPRPSW